MLERLLELRKHITTVLVDSVKTPKADHRALLMKEKRWATAEKLIKVLAPAEKATALLSGQKYLTMSCILPVMMSLRSMADSEAASAAGEDGAVVRHICQKLSDEIATKFALDPLDLSSHQTVAAALDPRSRSLPFLDASGRSAVKAEVLYRCTSCKQTAGWS
eukprot:scpid87561/ scgid12763/ Zinc finger BED domain-containing protein 1; Putative Ac-like transposable element; dREF homolog